MRKSFLSGKISDTGANARLKALTRLISMFMIAGSAVVMAVPIRAEPEQRVAELIEDVSQAAAAGDEPGQLAAYQELATLLAEDSANQSMMGLVVQADLQRDIARATYAIGDDPCPALDQGMAYLVQARAIPAGDEAVGAREIMGDLERRFMAERRRMRCKHSGLPTDIGAPDAAFVGHYYLSGVMETGSELLLKADGRFDWYISYGSVDQSARGQWGRMGETVTLVADLASDDAPLFRADEVFPWDETAERYLREFERGQQADLMAARCPWAVSATTSLSSYALDDAPPAGAAERDRATKARLAAEAARDEASRLVAAAVAANASDRDRAAADAAMAAWYAAQADMAQAYYDANLPEPDIGAPAMPPACQPPGDEPLAQIAAADWRRGVGVVIGDPARELRLSRVDVTFVFSDGHREMTKSRRGGFAFAPMRKGAAVEQLILSLSEPVARTETLSIKPMSEGIQAVLVDTQQIVEPAFEVMRLDVNGADLVPQDMLRGRYSRH